MNDRASEIKKRLLGDSSLAQIIETYESAFPKPLKNTNISRLIFTLAAALSTLTWFAEPNISSVFNTLDMFVNLSMTLSGVSLGLGLAGIAISTSNLNPDTLDLLTKADYPGTSVSTLKFILSTFAYVIVAFLKLVLACTAYTIFIQKDSFLLDVASYLLKEGDNTKIFAGLMFFPVLSFYFTFALTNLFSFIFNMHKSILLISAINVVLQSEGKDAKKEHP